LRLITSCRATPATITRFPDRDHFASYTATAPLRASSGDVRRQPLVGRLDRGPGAPARCRGPAKGDEQVEPPSTDHDIEPNDHGLGWSRGGLTTKLHLACEQGQRPLSLIVTAGQAGDSPQLEPVLEAIRVPRQGCGRPRCRPDRVLGDKAYSSRANRAYRGGGASPRRSRSRRIRSATGDDVVQPVVGRRRSARRPTSSATPWSAATDSSATGRSPPASTNSPSTTSPPSGSPPSPNGCADLLLKQAPALVHRQRPDKHTRPARHTHLPHSTCGQPRGVG
jgi:Transposase DDE domain